MTTELPAPLRVTAILENLEDVFEVQRGIRAPHDVRRVELSEAIVQTWETMLYVPEMLVRQLRIGVLPHPSRRRRPSHVDEVLDALWSTASHAEEAGGRWQKAKDVSQVYRAVRLSVQGRDCISDVVAVPDGGRMVIGRIPLALMDLVPDSNRQHLVVNRAAREPSPSADYMSSLIGAFADDPDLPEIRRQIYRDRGRPEVDE